MSHSSLPPRRPPRPALPLRLDLGNLRLEELERLLGALDRTSWLRLSHAGPPGCGAADAFGCAAALAVGAF